MQVAQIVHYRDFWDFPKIFLVSYKHSLFLFDCKFNVETEDFEDEYNVYIMPLLEEEAIAGSWSRLPERAIKNLGVVPVNEIKFD
jgi:hypothetical protein